MKLTINSNECKIILAGNTYHLKDEIKKIGGKWDPIHKNWWLIQNQLNIENLKNLGFTLEQESEKILGKIEEKIDSPALSVTSFIQFISSIIHANLKGKYWICGEISNLKQSNNHLFFDLVDKEQSAINFNKAASISCSIWASNRIILEQKLNQILFVDGTKIKILIRCDFRKEGARITGIVEDIDIQFTQGELALQKLAIIQELKKQGLYFKNKNLIFPQYPLKIALITAKESRAYSDFLNELSLAQIAFQVSVFDCNMQGEKTAENVVNALKKIAQNTILFDCVVITRGGGSRLDLRWFDDFEIAAQIARCPLPVITAIGHFEDISIADEVAKHSEKTPTAAARILCESIMHSFQTFFQRVENIANVLQKRLTKEKTILASLNTRLTLICQQRLQLEKKQLQNIEKMLKIYKSGMQQNLQRGYALVYDDQNTLLQGKHFLTPSTPKNLKLKFAGDCENHHIFVDVIVKAVTESREST